ncbi:MAG: hypothetical protein ABJF01_17950 [bacterium]
MDVVRRVSLVVTIGLLGIAVMLGWVSARPTLNAGTAKQLAAATSYFDTTIVLARAAGPRGSRGDELAISLGYLERLRLGLGSPFRLVAEATVDPRLSRVNRSRVAWALLGRLDRGDAYVVDSTVLDGVGPWGSDGHGATGAAHMALIDRVIHSASDPRAGELTVRLAYLIESAKGGIAPAGASIAAQVAALVRDRDLAETDLHDLFATAAEQHVGALGLVSGGRANHAFRVEQPPLAPLSSSLQMEAMNDVPDLVRALDTLERTAALRAGGSAVAMASSPVLGSHFAARLRSLAADRPPVPQIVITLRGHARPDLPLRATNDEMLAAAYASLGVTSDSVRRAGALAMLSSAVALRSLAQAEPWFPGDAGPGVGDLTTEFGLADVSFARSVPGSWRPYYLRELQNGLRDLQGVLPAFSVAGLSVRFSTDALRDSALAMHDPRTRTIQLSIATSAGTLAHELSHDLDWQAARRLFPDGGGYSSDRAVRERRGQLASSLRGLTEARLLRPYSAAASTQPGDRPAELFARGTDWFVASTLAQQGRMNGFLSAIEDGWFAGYAAGPPTAIGSAATESLVSAIEEMTYVPDSVRLGFESQWSDPQVVDPLLLVRRALEMPIGRRSALPWRSGPAAGLRLPPTPLCTSDRSPQSRVRENLLMLAVDARAQGMALRRARYWPVATRPAWASSVLGIPPYSSDERERMVDALHSSIIGELTTAVPDQGVVPVVPAIFRSSAASCSTSAH